MTTSTTQTWDGSRLNASFLALEVVPGDTSPRASTAALTASASDGQGVWLIAERQLGAFLRAHQDAHLVCVSAGELHRRLHDHLSGDAVTRQLLWKFVDDGRLSDVGLLHQLLRLAQAGASHPPRLSLERLASDYTHPALSDKDDAGTRAGAVARVFIALGQPAHAAGLVSLDAGGIGRFGFLSMALQVKGDVALAHADRHGLHFAPRAIETIVRACEAARDSSAAKLLADTDARQWLRTTARGCVKLETDGSASIRRKELRAWLVKMANEVQGLHQTEFLPPPGDGTASDTPAEWGSLVRYHRLLCAWHDLVLAPQVARSCLGDGSGRLHPKFEVLPRFSSREPDLEVLRRLGVRDAFQPAPGHVFLAVRLKDLKLRALAAVCQRRPGGSTLAELFAREDDPCLYAAGALARLRPGACAGLAQQTPEEHERWLRAADTLLSAAPLGISADRVCEIVCEQPGWAEEGRAKVADCYERLMSEVFRELDRYLRDDTLEVLAGNMSTTSDSLQKSLGVYFRAGGIPPMPQLRKWYREYGRLTGRTKDNLQALLEHASCNPTLDALLQREASDHELFLALFGRDVVTLSGRVRGRLPFSQARSAEYLDLADDAAKLALYAVVRAGYRVVAYATETILVELPEGADTAAQAEVVKNLARQGVAEGLAGIPARCETALLSRW